LLIAFIVAQVRDFVPVWFIPFLPAGVVLSLATRRALKIRPARLRTGQEPGLDPIKLKDAAKSR
jgi:hypothetical protein